jgi:hypothetical protein
MPAIVVPEAGAVVVPASKIPPRRLGRRSFAPATREDGRSRGEEWAFAWRDAGGPSRQPTHYPKPDGEEKGDEGEEEEDLTPEQRGLMSGGR